MDKKAIILINIGTPDKPETNSVRNYLSEFLNDSRVMTMPWLIRKFLVNVIIVPFRAKKSAKLYEELWDKDGSPLLYLTNNLAKKLENLSEGTTDVFVGMRYGNPNLSGLINELNRKNYEELIFVPLFPQYASSTTGSSIELILQEFKKLNIIRNFRIINQFYDNTLFIDAYAELIGRYNPERYDHIVFSYHGLPLSHLSASHPEVKAEVCSCENSMPEYGAYCYKATCYETTRLIAAKLGLKKENYSVSFQSRLTNKWLEPFTDQVLAKLAASGNKKVLITAPSFVTDCLETIVELGRENAEIFKHHGGEELTLVRNLNDSDNWAMALKKIIFED